MTVRAAPALALFALAALACAAPASAAAASCPAPSGPPTVRLEVLDGGVSYDLTRTAAQIAAIGGQGTPGGTARGLTATKFRSGYSVSFERTEVPGGVCLRPVEIEARVGFDPTLVYVERKYPRGSCQFRVVLEHEHEHVRINRETLAARLPRIRAALERAASGGAFPLFAADYGTAKAMAIGAIGGAFNREIDALARERDALNARLDSPRSYRASQAACASW